MKPRTQFDLPMRPDLVPTLDQWASETSYLLQKEYTTNEGTVRLYQKGTGLLVAPMMLQVTALPDRFRMEAWVHANLFVRIMSLFILPEEMHVESGGFRGSLPRKIARDAINKLLVRIGANPIP